MFTSKWKVAYQCNLDEIHVGITFSLCFSFVLNSLFPFLPSKCLLHSLVGWKEMICESVLIKTESLEHSLCIGARRQGGNQNRQL